MIRVFPLLFFMLGQLPAHAADHDQTLIRNVQLISMQLDRPLLEPGQSVLISGGVIKAIGPAATFEPAAEVDVIEGNGQYLLPGLIDAHVHIWDRTELNAYLAYGVTAVRNASGMPFHLEYARAIEAGELTGPYLQTTGPILNSPGPNQQPNHKLISTAEEAVAAVRDQYQQGYRHIKVYSNLSRAAYEAVLSEAAALGMTVMGHSPEGLRDEGIPQEKPFHIAFEEILDDGLVTLEHMETIVWHGLYDALDKEALRELAQNIAKTGNAVTPTLLAHHNLAEVARTQGAYLARPGTSLLNPFISALEQPVYDFWSAQPVGARQKEDSFYQMSTRIMQEEGVPLSGWKRRRNRASRPSCSTPSMGRSSNRPSATACPASLLPFRSIRRRATRWGGCRCTTACVWLAVTPVRLRTTVPWAVATTVAPRLAPPR